MKEVQLGLSVLIIIIFCWMLALVWKDTSKTSSPVEDMHHTELVTTIDSILDARCIVKDTIDNDEITVPHDSLGHVLMSN